MVDRADSMGIWEKSEYPVGGALDRRIIKYEMEFQGLEARGGYLR